jgi:hypothetical protein
LGLTLFEERSQLKLKPNEASPVKIGATGAK